jgi:hypothetical protein
MPVHVAAIREIKINEPRINNLEEEWKAAISYSLLTLNKPRILSLMSEAG